MKVQSRYTLFLGHFCAHQCWLIFDFLTISCKFELELFLVVIIIDYVLLYIICTDMSLYISFAIINLQPYICACVEVHIYICVSLCTYRMNELQMNVLPGGGCSF